MGMPPVVPFSENVISRDEAIKLWNELDAMGTMMIQAFYGFTMGAEEPQFAEAVTAAAVAARYCRERVWESLRKPLRDRTTAL